MVESSAESYWLDSTGLSVFISGNTGLDQMVFKATDGAYVTEQTRFFFYQWLI